MLLEEIHGHGSSKYKHLLDSFKEIEFLLFYEELGVITLSHLPPQYSFLTF